MRERIAEELDYELEAQNQRRIERLMRGHPFVVVPRVHTDLSTPARARVRVRRGPALSRTCGGADEPERDRYGEIVFRFFFGLLYRDRIALGDPHPGNYLLRLRRPRLLSRLRPGSRRRRGPRRRRSGRSRSRSATRSAAALKRALVAAGYLPAGRAEAVDAEFALRLMRRATRWYAVPGERRFSSDHADRGRDGVTATGAAVAEADTPEQRAAIKAQVNQFTVPPESILIRRMHGIVGIVLGQLRAGADWGAIAAEYLHGEPPATALGEAEADFLARRGRRASAGAERRDRLAGRYRALGLGGSHPAVRLTSCWRSSRRSTLPLAVFGSSSTNSTWRGYL